MRLPQLAVFANFLCLLMVACCGAAPGPYRVTSVRLYSDCSRGYLSVLAGGRVVAKRNNANLDTSNLTMTAWAPNFNLTIFAEEARRYVCFDKHLKLVAQKERGPGCFFLEEMDMSGYNKYRLAQNQSIYLGFNKVGRPLRGRPAPKGTAAAARRERCLLFTNIHKGFSVEKHNSRKAAAAVAGSGAPQHRLRHHRNPHQHQHQNPHQPHNQHPHQRQLQLQHPLPHQLQHQPVRGPVPNHLRRRHHLRDRADRARPRH